MSNFAPAIRLVIALSLAGNGPAGARPIKVVELFQSKDCAACPDAQTNLNALADHADILALSYPVSFRDPSEWRAAEARPEFMARQAAYAEAIGTGGVATPQMILNGRLAFPGNAAGEVAVTLKDATALEARPRLSLAARNIVVSGPPRPRTAVEIWLIGYSREAAEPGIGRRRGGEPLALHRNIVRSISRIGQWRGGETRIALPAIGPGLAHAIVLQQQGMGPIFAAVDVPG
jgi:hypothetical protein